VSPVRRAGKHPAATMCGIGELDRARLHADRAVAELRAACQVWGVWADGVRQRAEERLGVTDLQDQRVLGDLEYARALDMGRPYIAAVDAAEAALQAGGSGGAVPARLPAWGDKHK
jgi:hypothetical protein